MVTNSLKLFDGCYSGRRVLVTGHTGFKGTWLCLWLRELGAQVFGYALEPLSQPSLFEKLKLQSWMKSYCGDVRDADHFQQVIHEVRPEIIFHMAAQSLVRKSYIDPVETFSTNIMGIVNLLETVRMLDSVRVCQVVTSDKCYENQHPYSAHDESDRLGGSDPYSTSKACSEMVVASYRSSYFNPDNIKKHGVSLSSVRGGNVVGGGDWAEDRIIPDCIRALRTSQPISIRNPNARRPWQYILDVLSGYLSLAEHQWREGGSYAEAWNFGSDESEPMCVLDLVERVIYHWGSGSWVCATNDDYATGDQMPESPSLRLDSKKAKQRLNWGHVYTLEESIAHVVQWYYEAHHNKIFDALSYTCNEISGFVDALKQKNALRTSAAQST